MPDAAMCIARAEECNNLDDDCDGTTDGPTASASCAPRDRATALTCTAGECEVSACESGFGDCDTDVTNGCEARLDTLANCGRCGTSCGWQCDDGTCNDAIAITAASDHQCVLLSTGRAACWGANERGQLGIGEAGPAASRAAPTYVVGPSGSGHLGTLAEIVTGTLHSCARTTDGEVWCWGANDSRQLGDGTTIDRALPVRASGVTRAVDLSVGARHTCAAREDGTVLCWGANERGQLGLGSTYERTSPSVVSGISDALSVSGMSSSTCAQLTDRTVRCWGSDIHGVLGNGEADAMYLPVSPIGISDVAHLVVGGAHACALLTDSALWCWGSNYNGQFTGLYEILAHPVPFELTTAPDPVAVFAGTGATFLVDGAGRAFEMGFTDYEEIEGEARVAAIALGNALCLIDAEGGVRCRSDPEEGFFDVPPPP
ncbi:MAG: hypothetical protein M3Y87_21295 [Myxococcota bacterium]|nr:hypothetical protein [Myxococcota bacterium]